MSKKRFSWLHDTEQSTLVRAYKILAKHANFKEGDKVRVIRKHAGLELGCGCLWSNSKQSTIGKVGCVVTQTEYGNFGVMFSKEDQFEFYPFFCLELVEPVIQEKVKVTVEQNGEKKTSEFTQEEWAKIEKTVN